MINPPDPAFLSLAWTILAAVFLGATTVFVWIVKTVWQAGITLEALRKDIATLLANRERDSKRLDDLEERVRKVEVSEARHSVHQPGSPIPTT